MKTPFARRHFLHGTSTLIDLPALEPIGFKAFAAPKTVTPPLCNVWRTLLNGLGVAADRHGDSTGVVKELTA